MPDPGAATWPKVTGHRGARQAAPENTLAGIREAARQGATTVEIDVMLTRDGVPILIHDETVDRTTNGTGNVADLDHDTIEKLDAGSWFGADFTGERVPTLTRALAEISRLGLGLNLEIKPSKGADEETARVAIETLTSMWPADRPAPMISSFSVTALAVARELAPDLPRGYLMEGVPDDWWENADKVAATTLNIDGNAVNSDQLKAFLESGRPVMAWTINDPGKAKALVDAGVTTVITDKPAAIASALAPSPAVKAAPRPTAKGPGT